MLPITDNKEARVCSKCYQDLIRGMTSTTVSFCLTSFIFWNY